MTAGAVAQSIRSLNRARELRKLSRTKLLAELAKKPTRPVGYSTLGVSDLVAAILTAEGLDA